MRYSFVGVIALLVMPAFSEGAFPDEAPVIKAPDKVTVKAGRIAKIKVETTGKKVAWINPQSDLMDLETMTEDGKTIILAVDQSVPHNTVFKIFCYTAAGDLPSQPVIILILVQNQRVIPPPPPNPDPPTPNPPLNKGWLIIIEETANATTTRAKLLSDIALQTYLKEKAWTVRISDQNAVDEFGNVTTDLAPYIERSKGKTLPQMYLVDQAGNVRLETSLPASPADVLQVLKKAGG